MELFRNAEVVLMLCFGLLCAAAMAAYQPTSPATAPLATADVSSGIVTIVVIRAKRLSAAEKAAAG